jgi:hypothetical protein
MTTAIDVERLMRELADGVSDERRTRLFTRGGPPEYGDPELFRTVERVLRRALESRAQEVRLLPDLLEDKDWRLRTDLRLSSHRPAVGGLLVFLKRRILLPAVRWLYEYSRENFRRQRRVNEAMFACIEQLAIENARLRQEMRRLGAAREP